MADAMLEPSVVYPDSDGMPMADNNEQLDMMTLIKEGLEHSFRDRMDVFVAADMLWYYREGDVTARVAPDVMVAVGRPPGRRGSYRPWDEGGIAPQFVVEVLSPSNSTAEMAQKRALYQRLGVEEYLEIDPGSAQIRVWMRRRGRLVEQRITGTWTSPRLGLRIDVGDRLTFRVGDGPVFRKPSVWIEDERRQAALDRHRADEAHRQAEADRHRADEAHRQAEADRHRADEAHRQAEADRHRADELQRRLDALSARE